MSSISQKSIAADQVFSTAFVGKVAFLVHPFERYGCIRLDMGGTAASHCEPLVVCQSSGVCRVYL